MSEVNDKPGHFSLKFPSDQRKLAGRILLQLLKLRRFEADLLEFLIEDLTQHQIPYSNCGLSLP